MIEVRNPHAVAAAILKRPKDVLEVHISKSAGSAWEEVAQLAKSKGIRLGSAGLRESEERPSKGQAGRKGTGNLKPQEFADKGGRASENYGILRPHLGVSIEELIQGANLRENPIFLALDCLQDPHNMGAVFRTAAFFGVAGIVMTEERSVGLTSVVYEVASGGVESVPFSMLTNLSQAFRVLKEAGFWILGTSEHAKDSLFQIKCDRPWLIVLGNEEKGMRRLTEENCDQLCSIPPTKSVTSLNISVASGIIIAHFLKP